LSSVARRESVLPATGVLLSSGQWQIGAFGESSNAQEVLPFAQQTNLRSARVGGFLFFLVCEPDPERRMSLCSSPFLKASRNGQNLRQKVRKNRLVRKIFGPE